MVCDDAGLVINKFSQTIHMGPQFEIWCSSIVGASVQLAPTSALPTQQFFEKFANALNCFRWEDTHSFHSTKQSLEHSVTGAFGDV